MLTDENESISIATVASLDENSIRKRNVLWSKYKLYFLHATMFSIAYIPVTNLSCSWLFGNTLPPPSIVGSIV